MIFNTKTTLLALVAAVAAQSSSPSGSASTAVPSTLGITTCILSCVQPAAASVGCAFTNTSCVCTSTQFQAAATACLKANCTSDEVTTALGLQQSQCKGLTPSGSGSSAQSATSPPGASNTAGGSGSGTSGGASPAATSNAASGMAVGGLLAIAAGVLGIVGI